MAISHVYNLFQLQKSSLTLFKVVLFFLISPTSQPTNWLKIRLSDISVLALIQINRAGHPIATSHEEPTKNAAGPENSVSSSRGDFRKTKPGGIEFLQRGISDGLAKPKEPSGWCSTSMQSISIHHPKVQAQSTESQRGSTVSPIRQLDFFVWVGLKPAV